MIDKLLGLRAYGYVGAACLVLGYGLGWHAESVRFAEYRGTVQAIGEAQEQRTKLRIAEDQLRRKEADEAHRKALARLAARHRDALERVRADSSRSVLPAVPPAPGDSGAERVCWERDDFNRRMADLLQRLAAGVAGITGRGDDAATSFQSCAGWALKEWKGQ